MDYDDPYPDMCFALEEDMCPVMLKEQDEPCPGCVWLKLNPNYKEVDSDE